MDIENLRQLIREVINEVDDDEPKDWENDPNDPEIDADITNMPLGDDEVWPGSDIAGSKVGGTSMPHGFGYPNSPFRRGRKLSRQDLEKILHLQYIEGVPEKDQQIAGKKSQNFTYQFIQKYMPWVFTYGYEGERTKEVYYPLAPYFSNAYETFEYWLNGFSDAVRQQLDHYTYWINFDKTQLKHAARYNRHWIIRYKWAKLMKQQHPTIESDLTRLLEFLNKLHSMAPTDPKNPKNYPFYVSFYDTTRRLGGHEEGGWWYDNEDLIDSIKVNNYKEMRAAAIHYLRMMGNADLNGKPFIIIEKESGSRGNKPPPSYS